MLVLLESDYTSWDLGVLTSVPVLASADKAECMVDDDLSLVRSKVAALSGERIGPANSLVVVVDVAIELTEVDACEDDDVSTSHILGMMGCFKGASSDYYWVTRAVILTTVIRGTCVGDCPSYAVFSHYVVETGTTSTFGMTSGVVYAASFGPDLSVASDATECECTMTPPGALMTP